MGDWGGVTGYLRAGPEAEGLARGGALPMLFAKAGGAKDADRRLPVRGGAAC